MSGQTSALRPAYSLGLSRATALQGYSLVALCPMSGHSHHPCFPEDAMGLAVQFFTGDRQDLSVPWEARGQVCDANKVCWSVSLSQAQACLFLFVFKTSLM